MRSPFRLSFPLPDGAQIQRAVAAYRPAFEGCCFDLYAAGLIVFFGVSRDAIFADVGDFLRELLPDEEPRCIHAILLTEPQAGMPGGRDSWSIITDAKIAFCPTGQGAQIPPPRSPALAAVNGRHVE